MATLQHYSNNHNNKKRNNYKISERKKTIARNKIKENNFKRRNQDRDHLAVTNFSINSFLKTLSPFFPGSLLTKKKIFVYFILNMY